MLDFLVIIVFCWLFIKVIKLVFRMAWGAAKLTASLLLTAAVPLLFVCLVFAGGIAVLLPLVLIGIAFALVKACV